MAQLYAKIKKSSNHYQQRFYLPIGEENKPFKVEWDPTYYGDGRFIGGPGGNYLANELNIYVRNKTDFVRIGK